jgi:hypothetical protein
MTADFTAHDGGSRGGGDSSWEALLDLDGLPLALALERGTGLLGRLCIWTSACQTPSTRLPRRKASRPSSSSVASSVLEMMACRASAQKHELMLTSLVVSTQAVPNQACLQQPALSFASSARREARTASSPSQHLAQSRPVHGTVTQLRRQWLHQTRSAHAKYWSGLGWVLLLRVAPAL